MKRESKQRNLVIGPAPGYTLIEMLVVLAIVSLLFSAVFGALNVSNNSFSNNFARQEIENKARQGLDNMLRELYETKDGTVVLSGAADSVVTFKLPVGVDGTGSLIWGAQGIPGYKISYLVENEQLVRKVLDASDNLVSQKVLSTDMQNLRFTKTSIGILTVVVNAKKKITATNSVKHSVTSKVAFRN